MGKIVLLDDLTINQIAAGEVIERPSSVVKEMVENSIDAGAKNITIEIKNGGISLIRITDDGSGIASDDMEIAFERHATSKIRKASDLEEVATMGFRGEALASVASIAKVEMISRTEDEEIGHKIVIEGGKILEQEEFASQKGTRITVENLFYNTPVRYKFLKKNYTEAGYIETVVTRIALINRDVAIKLIHNDKVLLQTNGSGDFKNIIYSIYGKDVANGIIDVDYTYQDMRVSGVIGVPDIARSNRSNQMFFVNNRYIKDGKLSSASEQAYRDLLPVGKYAFIILNIEVDPKKVDVNVHPAKLEVRFEEDAEVFRAVYNAVKAGLANMNHKNETGYEKQEMFSELKPVVKPEQEEIKEPMQEEVPAQKQSFASILKKFIKEPEETKEELENNKLRDIYNTRNGIKTEEIATPKVEEIHLVESIVQNVVEEIKPVEEPIEEPAQVKVESPKISNEDIVEKEIKLGDTKISSNTRELDFDINEALKQTTQVLDTTKKLEIQETQVIPATKTTVAQETQVVNLKEDSTENIKEDVVENDNSEEKEFTEITKKEEKTLESTVPSLEAVENITSRILELKINNIDSTQMIDTTQVRDAINEANDITPEFANMYKKTFGVDANIIRKEREIEEREREKINVSNEFVNAENTTLFENKDVIPARVNYKLIGTAFDTNIIIELNNEMYIIDQNAAIQRITYEIIKANYYRQDKKDSQNLLLPDIITATYREMSIAKENIDLFENAGFAFEEFGENTLKLTAVPSLCEELNTKQLFLNVLNEIDRVALDEKEEKEKKFIVALAKYSTKKIGRKLDEKEIDELMQQLLVLDNPFDTVHGAVTAIKMSRADIEKKFSRRK
jgi:DNA mismatch repair protein MutL